MACGNIATGTLLTGEKITIFGQYLALASIAARPSRVVNISTAECRLGYSIYASSVSSYQQTSLRLASVNLVNGAKPRRYAEDNRT